MVFESAATNLTVGDTNGYTDIFVWDRTDSSLTNLSSLMTPISFPNNSCTVADIAVDGAYGGVIVFQTAKQLVAKDTSSATDIYAFNFADSSFQLVSAKADGTGVGLGSEDASVSGDGHFVVFTSGSGQLVAGDTNGTSDIFVKDLQNGQIALVSKSAAGVAANGPSIHAQISLGGEWIVFESSATNLATTNANGGGSDVFRVSNPLLKDTLAGGLGNDTYVLERADIITEALNGGTDTIRASMSYTLGANLENLVLAGTANYTGKGNTLNNVITGNAGNNLIDGLAGVDTASYAAATTGVTVSLAVTIAQNTGTGSDTLLNVENLMGSNFNDRLTGNALANRLDGGLGNDTLTGGAGDDTYVVNSSAEVIVEGVGAGTDTVLSAVNWTLQSTLENLTLTGTTATTGAGNSANNVIIGNALNNMLTGNAGNDRLDGGLGNDTLTGGEGSDTYVCNSAADVTVEAGMTVGNVDTVIAGVSWTLQSTLENLTLSGSAAINGGGNSQANVIIGNAAANVLSGAAGNDDLRGGSGNDVFVLDSLVGSDTTSDFTTGSDDVRIRQGALKVGDGDLLVEGGVVRAAPGGFSSTAELVIFSANAPSLSTTAAAAAIGAATTAFAADRMALFVVDSGINSGVYLFHSAGVNAQVSATELTLLATLTGTASTGLADYLFAA